jgi:iron complex transport system ATP-binding protein
VCQSLLERLHLSRFADRPISTLSGGETQRAVLARALAQQAPVLLLDEPTSALDIGRRVEALELVDALRRERALTVLSVLHDLTLAAQFADRLVLLVDGTVRASGTPAEVLDPGVLAASYGARVRVLTGDDGRLVVVPQRAERKHPEPS